MSLDATKISIISSKKVDPQKLLDVGDTSADLPQQVKAVQQQEKRCNGCCTLYGSLLSTVMVSIITASATAITINAEKRVNYSINGAVRQAAWLAIPGIAAGATLHFFLSEAMWSNKRNSWGQAWTKAFLFNTLVWCTGVGTATLVWRKLMPLTAAGRRLYYRFPIPTEPLETRLLRSERDFFTGMGWTYWLSGVGSGQMGLVVCVAFCIWNDRPYMMMAPRGGYARRCMPPWRREQLVVMANAQSVVASSKTP